MATKYNKETFRTGETCYKIHSYEDDYLIIWKWWRQHRFPEDLIGESVFAHQHAAEKYDPSKGPWLPFLRLYIRSHMQTWKDYKTDLIHVPLLKRDEVSLEIVDGDKGNEYGNETIWGIIEDESAISPDCNISEEKALKQIKKIIDDIKKRPANQTEHRQIILNHYLDIKAENMTIQDLIDLTNTTRSFIYSFLDITTKVIRKHLTLKNIEFPY